MKRKIFSKLLMVALVIAAVGSFVSCKDYDDDINNLQKQIDAKAALSELTALQSTLASQISAAQSAAAAAQATADAAATKTAVADLKTALETAIADAKKAGTDAGTQAGEAITKANAAATAAEEAAQAAKDADAAAKKALEDALEDIKATYATKAEAAAAADAAADAAAAAAKANAAIEKLGDTYFTIAEAEKLQKQVDDLKADLESQIEEKVKEAIKNVDNAVASVDAIWSAVTSVELFFSQNANASAGNPGQRYELYLLTGEEVDDDFGGATGSKASKLQVLYQDGHALEGDITSPISYKAGDEISFDNRVIIRVNPANAVVNKEDIVLINSLGDKTLNELVEVKSVEDYNKLITRAGVATGLKVVTFARKANVTDAALAAATEGPEIKAPKIQEDGTALFAVGINNTKDAADKRFVYTTFELGVKYGEYVPESTLNFFVKGSKDETKKYIDNLKNRYNGAKLVGEDLTRETPVAPYTDGWYPEFVWAGAADKDIAPYIPAVDTTWVTTDGKKKNFGTGDARQANQIYVVTTDTKREFTIYAQDTDPIDVLANSWNNIQYYYVTLDKCAAVESAPSEYQAWKKYEYEGLYTITPATENLTVKILSEAAIGDIIGFRVWAVNYDGTLVDPDGRSFYVQVGEPAAAAGATVNVAFTAANTNGAATDAAINAIANELAPGKTISGTYNLGVVAFDPAAAGFKMDATTTFKGDETVTAATSATDAIFAGATYNSVQIHWAMLDKDYAIATALNKVKFIGIAVDHAGNFLDSGSYSFTVTTGVDTDHHDAATNNLTINVSKQFLSTPVGFAWKPTYEPVGGVKYFYPVPNSVIAGQWQVGGGANWADWTAAPAGGQVSSDMNNFAAGITAAYAWNFWTKSDKKTAIATTDIDGSSNQNLYVHTPYIGTKNKTVYGEYGLVYAGIACNDADKDGSIAAAEAEQNKMVNAFAGNVVFEDVNTLSTFAFAPYTYGTAGYVATVTQPTATSSMYCVAFSNQQVSRYQLGYSVGAAGTVAWDAAATLSLDGTVLGNLVQKNSVVSVMNNVIFDPANFPTVVSCKVGNDEVMSATYAPASGEITFAQVAASAPLSDIEQTVVLKLKDVLNNEITISFPIKIVPAPKADGFMN